MREADVFKKIIDPKFLATELDWDTKVGLAAALIENREIYQKALGKLAATLPRQKTRRGDGQVAKFAEAIEGITGRKTSANSLRVYRRVYEVLEPVIDQIPQDWAYRSWRKLADSPNPQGYLMKGIQEGWSGPELIFNIDKDMGKVPTKNIKICPKCGWVNKNER